MKESDKFSLNLLESKPTVQLLNKWLAGFVLEAQRANAIPPLIHLSILFGLLRHAHSHWKDCPNILDKQNNSTILLLNCDDYSDKIMH